MISTKFKLALGAAVVLMLAGGVTIVALSRKHAATISDTAQASEIFRSVLQTYASLSSYSDTGKVIFAIDGKTVLTTAFSIRMSRPDLFRIECEQVQNGGATNHGAVWSDGSGDFRMLNDFTQKMRDGINALSMSTAISDGSSSTIPGAFFSYRMGGGLMPSLQSELTREKDEKIGPADCYVFSTMHNSQYSNSKTTIWIGIDDHLLHQLLNVRQRPNAEQSVHLTASEIETHENIKVNQSFSNLDFAR